MSSCFKFMVLKTSSLAAFKAVVIRVSDSEVIRRVCIPEFLSGWSRDKRANADADAAAAATNALITMLKHIREHVTSGVEELSALMTMLPLYGVIVSSCLKSRLEEVLFQFEPSEDEEVQYHPSAPIVVEKSPSVVASMFYTCVAKAMECLHANGIIHSFNEDVEQKVHKMVKGVWLLEMEKLEIVSTN
ncbi:hypothetical protein Tco_0933433 [Tanacetum coccineum]